MSRLPLNALRTFEAVVRCDGFGAAADYLCVSQSAVSHQIRHLERWMGAPLFEREGNRPRLLPHGEALARTLGASLSEIDAACARARRGSAQATLVIAAVPSVAVCWLIPRLASFRARRPELAVRVIHAFHGRDIDYGDVDLAFVYAREPPAGAGTRARDFLSGTAVPVCSPAVHDALDGRHPAAGIGHVEFLHDTDTAGWTRWFALEDLDVPTPPGTVYEDFSLLRAAALAGQGVALCPAALLDDDLRTGRLVRLPGTGIDDGRRYWLVERVTNDPFTAGAVNEFKAWLFETRDTSRQRRTS